MPVPPVQFLSGDGVVGSSFWDDHPGQDQAQICGRDCGHSHIKFAQKNEGA